MYIFPTLQRTVLHKNKIKMEANRPSSSSAMNSSQQTREKMALDYANAQHVKNSERYRRAREDYIKRKDREFSEHLKVCRPCICLTQNEHTLHI